MPTLDRDVAALLRELDDTLPATDPNQPPALVRQQFALMIKQLRTTQPEPFAGVVADVHVPGPAGPVHARTYAPAISGAARRASTTSGLTVWIHGGGWVVGDLDSADPSARALATRTGALVVSVDYRLAPEHPFPAALDDCRAVLEHAAAGGFSKGGQPAWTAVGGDSAGGNLAAALALDAPSRGVQLAAALLIYPALDPRRATPSHRDFADGYLLTTQAMRYYWNAYAGSSALTAGDHLLQPAESTDVSSFPPTVLTTAGFDPLRDEGDAFATRLTSAGVPLTHLRAEGLTHGWLDMTDRVTAARTERARTFSAFAQLLADPS